MAGVGLAGCLSSGGQTETATTRPTDGWMTPVETTATRAQTATPTPDGATPTATYSFGSGEPVVPTVADASATGLVAYKSDEIRPVTLSTWYLFVRVTVGAESLSYNPFSVRYDSNNYKANSDIFKLNSGFWDGERIDPRSETLESGKSAWLVFNVPRVSGDTSPRLVFDNTERTVSWPLPSETVERLRSSPPTPPTVSVSVPDVVTPEGPIPVTVTASNDQDRRVYVTVGINDRRMYRARPVTMELAPGETSSVAEEFPNPGQYDISVAEYTVFYPGKDGQVQSRQFDVPIRKSKSTEVSTTNNGTTTATTTGNGG